MNSLRSLKGTLVVALAASGTQLWAQSTDTAAGSGFLQDYSLLQPSPQSSLTQYYLAPGAGEKLKSYTSIMIDHPEVFILSSSPYKGIKPANLSIVAQALRQSVSDALQDDYEIVEQPGAGVLYLRLALVDLNVTKDRLHVLGYTPVGLAAQGIRAAAAPAYDNAVRHTSLVSLKIEGQISDSQSAELLGEFVDDFSSHKTPKGWKELQTEMQLFGSVVECQLKNAAAPEDARVNCRAADAATPTP